MYEANSAEKGGSPYIQSKVVQAKDRLAEAIKKGEMKKEE